MFDSVRKKSKGPREGIFEGLVVAVLLYGGLLVLALFLTSAVAEKKADEPEVTFFAAAPRPPPPPPAANLPTARKKPVTKKRDVIVQPKEIPQEQPPEVEPKEQPEDESPDPDGQIDGVPGGVRLQTGPGVLVDELGSGLGSTEDVVDFGEGMTRPDCAEARREHPVEYSREAREALVQGLMLLKCSIMMDGSMRNCRIIKPLPHMELAALEAVRQWKCSPVTLQGRPISVDYVIQLRLVMPR